MNFLCKFYNVSRSGFYAWLKRPESQRIRENRRLGKRIEEIFEKSRGTYGSPRIKAALSKEGIEANRKRIARLMQKKGVGGTGQAGLLVEPKESSFL